MVYQETVKICQNCCGIHGLQPGGKTSDDFPDTFHDKDTIPTIIVYMMIVMIMMKTYLSLRTLLPTHSWSSLIRAWLMLLWSLLSTIFTVNTFRALQMREIELFKLC